MTRIRGPKLNFDGSNVSCTTYSGVPISVANVAKAVITIDCDSASNPAVTSGAANVVATSVLGLYSEYRYNSCRIEYIPSIGPAGVDAGSRIHIAYIDNAEKMLAFFTASAAASLNLVRGCRNVRTFNGWERFTYNVPLTWRRRVFDTNTTTGVAVVDLYERATQGMVIVAVETISAAVILGTFKVDSSVRVEQLNVTLTT